MVRLPISDESARQTDRKEASRGTEAVTMHTPLYSPHIPGQDKPGSMTDVTVVIPDHVTVTPDRTTVCILVINSVVEYANVEYPQSVCVTCSITKV